ncbi:hypothetical protein CAEBREN_01677 [Caenorhabditis brenneri]|uniref:C2H2-type domain-containing protein n=1 Tax=Caenorhabditis brenneri TaxID=135651 RepID=G0PEX6_CAEBE|nr:hypothetical protein CAEBREN_01677 [Caenorhabditis brenneri]
MTDRKQDFSCGPGYEVFGGDEFNLQFRTSEEDDDTNNRPKVLTTMRNMFAERKSDDYELVYDVPGQRQQRVYRVQTRPVQVRQTRQTWLSPPPAHNQTLQNLSQHQFVSPVAQPRIRNIQNVVSPQRMQVAQIPPIQQIQAVQNPQQRIQIPQPQISNFVPNPGPPQPLLDVKEEEEDDHEEEDDESSFEDFQNRIVHQCPECSKKYTSERRLKHHIQVHKNADAYKCPKCGYCYQSPDSLRRHWKWTFNFIFLLFFRSGTFFFFY